MNWFSLEFPFGAADTTKEVKFPNDIPNGVCRITKVNVPDFAGAPTVTFDIYDFVPDKIYTKSGMADATVTLLNAATDVFPIVPGGKAVLTATGAPGGVMSCWVTFFIFDI